MNMSRWTPPSEGALELSPILTSMAAFKDRLLVVSGLDSKEAMTNDAGPHPRAQTTWLTGSPAKRTEGIDPHAGISMDQVAAFTLGEQTQLKSLELALEPVDALNGNCAAYGYACIYSSTISWRTADNPLPMEVNPRAVFERLFGASDSTDQKARVAQIRKDRSLLDAINDKLAHLQGRLGQRDRAKLADYVESVRDVERRIHMAEAHAATELPVIDKPAGVPATFEEHGKLMFDLLALALQTDVTRVSTMLYSREGSLRGFPEIGIPDAWHPLSHHQDAPEKLEKQAKLNVYHMRVFAHFIERLNAIADGEGSLLDQTTVLYGSGMSDSNLHAPFDVPTMVLGGPAGLKGGRHVRCPKGTPLSNLQLTLLQKMGIDTDHFGDSTGTLSNV
jgi:hypothetical protein